MSKVLIAALVIMTGPFSSPASAANLPPSFQVSATPLTKADQALLQAMEQSLKAHNFNEADSILTDLIAQDPGNKARIKELIYRFVDTEYPSGPPPGGWQSAHEVDIKWLRYLIDNKINVQAEDYLKIAESYSANDNWQEAFTATNSGLFSKPAPRTELELYYLNTQILLALHKPGQALKNLDKIKPLLQKLYTTEKYTRENYYDDSLSLAVLTLMSDYSPDKKPDPAFNKKQAELESYLISQALKLSPNFDLPYARQSELYVQTDQYQQALAAINKAIQLDSGNYKHYDNRGDILFLLKSPASALKDYQKALSLLDTTRQKRELDELEKIFYDMIQRRIKLIEDYS